jgi:hypothetical protein
MNKVLAPALLAAGMALAAANWMLQPDRALAWGAAVLLLAVMGLVLVATRGSDRGSIAKAVGFAGVMMVVSLGAKLAVTLGLVQDPSFARRATNVFVGVLLVVMGNDIPKQLAPLTACNDQPQQRLAGWAWVLTGFGYAVAWIALPVEVADPVTTALVVSCMLVTVAPLLWRGLRRA